MVMIYCLVVQHGQYYNTMMKSSAQNHTPAPSTPTWFISSILSTNSLNSAVVPLSNKQAQQLLIILSVSN